MRKVKIPIERVIEWAKNPVGTFLRFPVRVDWEELQLTEEQIIANSFAIINNEPVPYPDNSTFYVEVTTSKD